MKIKLKKLHKDAIIPTYGTEDAAALDLYAVEDYSVKAGKVIWLRTGIAIEIPEGYYVEMYNRSSMAAKREIIIVSSRVIDSDYRGEVVVPVKCIADIPDGWFASIEKGDRIAQMILKKKINVEFEEVEELSETDRGTGGFGSTGK
jgi:dUTP pyrophosphatase